MSGTSAALESLETSFHQDLNGDGVIGPVVTTVIEAFGSTSLVEVGNNFYLNSISSGSGPELKYGGAAVVAGQFGAWTPIGAEQTATGYEVAWKVPGADQYTVWNTDSSGNYISNIGAVSGTSSALESLETSFHQDLNGDGVIGVPTAATNGNATQSISVMIGGPSNDMFVFQPGVGAEAIVNTASADKAELDGYQSAGDTNLTTHDAQTDHWLVFQSASSSRDWLGQPGWCHCDESSCLPISACEQLYYSLNAPAFMLIFISEGSTPPFLVQFSSQFRRRHTACLVSAPRPFRR